MFWGAFVRLLILCSTCANRMIWNSKIQVTHKSALLSHSSFSLTVTKKRPPWPKLRTQWTMNHFCNFVFGRIFIQLRDQKSWSCSFITWKLALDMTECNNQPGAIVCRIAYSGKDTFVLRTQCSRHCKCLHCLFRRQAFSLDLSELFISCRLFVKKRSYVYCGDYCLIDS